LTPSLEVAGQLSEELGKFGDISSDGRPILNIHPAGLIEIVMSLDSGNLIFLALNLGFPRSIQIKRD